jgi:hypothetical protein
VVPEAVTVAEVRGPAQVRRAGSKRWEVLRGGDRLTRNDKIRTGVGATVRLRAADHTIVLVPGTLLRVGELTAELSGFLLGRGMVRTTATGPREIRLTAEGSDVEVRARQGRFDMASNGEGTVAVASLEGEVKVRAAGEAVVLQGGQETLVRKGKAPLAPRPIAKNLLLRVRWPPDRQTNKRMVKVSGRARPGALVYVDGHLVRVRDDGSFSTRVKLREGQNHVSVEGMAAGGARRKERGPLIVVDTTGADAEFETSKLWGQ